MRASDAASGSPCVPFLPTPCQHLASAYQHLAKYSQSLQHLPHLPDVTFKCDFTHGVSHLPDDFRGLLSLFTPSTFTGVTSKGLTVSLGSSTLCSQPSLASSTMSPPRSASGTPSFIDVCSVIRPSMVRGSANDGRPAKYGQRQCK